jgi:hypothetical protein
MLVEASHRILRACVTLLLLLSAATAVRTYAQNASGQHRQSKLATPHAEAPTWQKSQQEMSMERKEQSQRVLGMLPQFGVTNRQDAAPLTHVEKFHLFLKSAFDPASIGIVGIQSARSARLTTNSQRTARERLATGSASAPRSRIKLMRAFGVISPIPSC